MTGVTRSAVESSVAGGISHRPVPRHLASQTWFNERPEVRASKSVRTRRAFGARSRATDGEPISADPQGLP